MFDVIETEPRYMRWSRRAFLVATPLVFIPFLLRGRSAVIYVSDNPFSISNNRPFSLPTFFAEVISYGYYEGTAAALLLALVGALIRRRSRRRRISSGAGLVWYLPAFAAGVEAMRHASLLGSRHGFTDMPTFNELWRGWVTAGVASVSVVLVCVLLGMVFSRMARDSTRLPVAAVAVTLSVAGGWCGVLSLTFPLSA
ncbi:MAG: hypothetical protein ACXW5U_13010 [Thermoanaerobaculia bacterium]